MASRKASDARERITAKIPTEPKQVKSAGRVLEILEYFDDLQRESTVMEIANTLGYPQSSTSALLRSLVGTGYLNYDVRKRTYIPSSRVALLGNWVNTPFFAEGAIISLMKELNEQTGDTVVLATRIGTHIQYIHVIQATSPARLHMTLGTARPIAASGVGYAMLSTMTDAEVTRIVMRVNAEAGADQPLVRVRELLDTLAVVRTRGYAATCDLVTRGGGVIAAPLPRVGSEPQMVIGIGGISEVIRSRETELATALLDKISKRFGTVPRHLEPIDMADREPLAQAIIRYRLLSR
jgi:DNA-binding IclR family transcriptional regulator